MSGESRLKRALAEPRVALRVSVALMRGYLVKLYYRLTNRRVHIGPDFRAYCRIRIQGPGKVVLGRNVSVSRGFQRQPAIVTHRSESVVRIGDGCDVSGARISCLESVTVGAHTLFGSTTIIDTDALPPMDLGAGSENWARQGQSITIGSSCWLGMNSFVLRGCRLGDQVVVAAGAVVREADVESGVVLLGNPARQVRGVGS